MAAHVEVMGERAFARERTASIPWTVWLMAAACTSTSIGGHWDISWHSSIGRDTFFTPAHIAIYLCGVFAGISAGWLIFSHTFLQRHDASASVNVFGLRGPMGAFLVGWGGLAMLTSAPFDDWWHSAYGLDVKILSPPHIVLMFGFYVVQIGALLMTIAERNRAQGEKRKHLELMFLYLGGLIVISLSIVILEMTSRVFMHTAMFYRTVALAIPLVLAAVARASGHRWGATIAAGVYTAFLLGFQWFLPLFPAEPKLGPVYNQVTYFVPPQFPLLLMVPALCWDLLWQRWRPSKLWIEAAVSGLVFVIAFFVVQYPFANFLMSDGAKNWFFGSHHFGYYVFPESYLRRGLFRVFEQSWQEYLWVMGQAVLAAFLLTWRGLALGNWIRAVQR